MAQLSILAPGFTEAESDDIVVGTTPVTVALYSADPKELPTGVTFVVTQKTPGAANQVYTLNDGRRSYVLAGPGTYTVKRPAYSGPAFGAFTEDGAGAV